VATALNLSPGERVMLLLSTAEGALNSVDLEIVGVFQSFSQEFDARAVRISLPAAHEALTSSAINTLVVSLQRTSDTEAVASRLGAEMGPRGLEVMTWVQLNDFYEKTVELYRRQFAFLQLIVLVMVVLSVANSVNMSIFERTGEFGTMRSLGDRSRDIFRLIVAENFLLGVIGSGVGVIIAVLLAFAISAIGIPMPPPPNANVGYMARIEIEPVTVLVAFSVGVAATLLAALWPATRASRIRLVDALRANI
jgi:putative ABC transport system permease protein